MRELNSNEIQKVNGGFLPLLAILVADLGMIGGRYKSGLWK